jgi:hypothetical protein
LKETLRINGGRTIAKSRSPSLRRHYPDQVLRVLSQPKSLETVQHPGESEASCPLAAAGTKLNEKKADCCNFLLAASVTPLPCHPTMQHFLKPTSLKKYKQ